MRKLTIDRDEWARGKGGSALRDPVTATLCCVGIYLRECGVPANGLDNIGSACEDRLSPHVPKEANWLLQEGTAGNLISSADAGILYEDNDWVAETYVEENSYHEGMFDSEEEREMRIAEAFARHDVEVTFVN